MVRPHARRGSTTPNKQATQQHPSALVLRRPMFLAAAPTSVVAVAVVLR